MLGNNKYDFQEHSITSLILKIDAFFCWIPIVMYILDSGGRWGETGMTFLMISNPQFYIIIPRIKNKNSTKNPQHIISKTPTNYTYKNVCRWRKSVSLLFFNVKNGKHFYWFLNVCNFNLILYLSFFHRWEHWKIWA